MRTDLTFKGELTIQIPICKGPCEKTEITDMFRNCLTKINHLKAGERAVIHLMSQRHNTSSKDKDNMQ